MLDQQRVAALLTAYQQIRPFTVEEQNAWQDMLCLAALRFWLSRLFDQFLPRAGEMTFAKDPDYFYYLLKQHRDGVMHPCSHLFSNIL
jgi:homoserine kinase type II